MIHQGMTCFCLEATNFTRLIIHDWFYCCNDVFATNVGVIVAVIVFPTDVIVIVAVIVSATDVIVIVAVIGFPTNVIVIVAVVIGADPNYQLHSLRWAN